MNLMDWEFGILGKIKIPLGLKVVSKGFKERIVLFQKYFCVWNLGDLKSKIFGSVFRKIKALNSFGHWKIASVMTAALSMFIFEFLKGKLLPNCFKLELFVNWVWFWNSKGWMNLPKNFGNLFKLWNLD